MKIIVKCNYVKFEFVDINEAVAFAETCVKHVVEDDREAEIIIKIVYEEDE